MAITYEIKIQNVRVHPQEELIDVIKEIDITFLGKDGECQFSLPVTVKLEPAEAASFTTFDELTEAQILTWLESYETTLAPHKQHITFVLEKEIEKRALTPKSLPWHPSPAPTPIVNE